MGQGPLMGPANNASKVCYTCQTTGHISRDCPSNTAAAAAAATTTTTSTALDPGQNPGGFNPAAMNTPGAPAASTTPGVPVNDILLS